MTAGGDALAIMARAPVRGRYRYTRVWAREGDGAAGDWRVVGGHVAPVPDATP